MQQFNIIYEENKKLDKKFDDLYNINNIDIIRKNKLELLVELGELTNETKCFKYWSNKPSDMIKVKEEYADCLIMVLSFFNMFNIRLDESFKIPKIRYDIVDLIGHLYCLCSEFYYNESRDLIKEIFVNFINLGYELALTDNEIIDACLAKIKKNFKRFEVGF